MSLSPGLPGLPGLPPTPAVRSSFDTWVPKKAEPQKALDSLGTYGPLKQSQIGDNLGICWNLTMKIGWGWLGRLIFGVISLTISVLASYYCSVVIRGDQINDQKIKQILYLPASCVCDCRPVWICVEKIICFHYLNKQVRIFIQDRQKDLRTVAGSQKNKLSFCRDVLCHVSTSPETLAHPFAWAKLNARMRPLCALDCDTRPGYPVTRLTGWSLSINAEYVRNDVEKLFENLWCKNDGIALLCIYIYIYTVYTYLIYIYILYTYIYRLYGCNGSLSRLLWSLLFHEVQSSNIKTYLKHAYMLYCHLKTAQYVFCASVAMCRSSPKPTSTLMSTCWPTWSPFQQRLCTFLHQHHVCTVSFLDSRRTIQPRCFWGVDFPHADAAVCMSTIA